MDSSPRSKNDASPTTSDDASRKPDESDEPQVKSWERFFSLYARGAISTAMSNVRHHVAPDAPEGAPRGERILDLGTIDAEPGAILVDWALLHNHDGNLADTLLARPYEVLARAQTAMKAFTLSIDANAKVAVRVVRLPTDSRVAWSQTRPKHLGRLIAVEGLVKSPGKAVPQLVDAVFVCFRCGNAVRMPQDEHLVLQEPLECYEDQGGCGREAKFKLVVGQHRGQGSVFEALQEVTLQEMVENTREAPQRFHAFLNGDLCGRVRTGHRVVFNGVLRSAVRKRHGVKTTTMDTFLEVHSIETDERDDDEIEVSQKERDAIEELAHGPDPVSSFAACIAPSLFGMEDVMRAVTLQLFGGLEKFLPDKRRIRGDIHILFLGDPGVAKSEAVRRAARLALRGGWASGGSSTGAGLIAAVVKDDTGSGDGQNTAEFGKMALSDRGFLAIDEFPRMREEDQDKMLEALEQQSTSIDKAGVHIEVYTRVAVLGAGNPKNDRYDPDLPLQDQVTFKPTLLSRFDVIYVKRDVVEAERDSKLADAVLLNAQIGGALANGATVEELPAEKRRAVPKIGDELLRKWIKLGKELKPQLTDEASALLKEYFEDMRRRNRPRGDEQDLGVPITARQLEGLVRLTEAAARVRLSEVERPDGTTWSPADIRDARIAIEIIDSMLTSLARTKDGRIDSARVSGTMDHWQRQRQVVIDVVRELQVDGSGSLRVNGAHIDEIVDNSERRGVPRPKALSLLTELSRGDASPLACEGDYYKPQRR